MRTVRRVEARRDDPLVDSMLTEMEGGADMEGFTDMEGHSGPDGEAPTPANDNQAPVSAPPPHPAMPHPAMPRSELEREARRYLRRLSEPGSFLLVTPDATKGGIFCKANDHTKPIAMLPVSIAVEFVREGWIRVIKRGVASIRYRIADDGRSYLKRLLSEDAIKRLSSRGPNSGPNIGPGAGFAEMATPFLAQHQLPGERAIMNSATRKTETLRVNLGEEPLGWLSRRKGPDGRPFLTFDEVEAGERLRVDFEMAQMGPSVAQDWRKFLTPGDRLAGTPVGRGPSEGPMRRVTGLPPYFPASAPASPMQHCGFAAFSKGWRHASAAWVGRRAPARWS
jgi:hypothetical protein